jgi:D-alanyl-D-alanine carboxypeptidase
MKNDLLLDIKEIGHLLSLWMPRRMAYTKTPGASVGIVYNGALVFSGNYEYGDTANTVNLSSNSRFHIASISKTFTAVALLQLQEAGKIQVTDKVSKYIPWFTGKGKTDSFDTVTIQNLLTHTSGLFRDGNTPHWADGSFPEDLRNAFSPEAKLRKSGSKFVYSNYGFALLGLIIENTSGKSYQKYVEENILAKLGMNDTAVDYDPARPTVTGHGKTIPGQKMESFTHHKANAYAPATGFISTVSDLSKFMIALTFNYQGTPILNTKSLQMLSKINKKIESGYGYSLGFDVYVTAKHKSIGHSGSYHGFNVQFILDQKSGLGVIVLTNKIRSFAYSLAEGIIQAIYALHSKTKKKSRSKEITDLSIFEGVYRNIWDDQLVVKLHDSLISFSVEDSNPFKNNTKLIPTADKNKFTMKTYSVFDSMDEIAEFTDFKDGKPQKVVWGATPAIRVN